MALRQKMALKPLAGPTRERKQKERIKDSGGKVKLKSIDRAKIVSSSVKKQTKTSVQLKTKAHPPVRLVDSAHLLADLLDVLPPDSCQKQNSGLDTDQVPPDFQGAFSIPPAIDQLPVAKKRRQKVTPHLNTSKNNNAESQLEFSENILNARCNQASKRSVDPSIVARVESAVSCLGKLESEIMAALFPTSGSLPETFESVATRLEMTVEEVKGIADNALRGLRGARGSAGRVSTVWN